MTRKSLWPSMPSFTTHAALLGDAQTGLFGTRLDLPRAELVVCWSAHNLRTAPDPAAPGQVENPALWRSADLR